MRALVILLWLLALAAPAWAAQPPGCAQGGPCTLSTLGVTGAITGGTVVAPGGTAARTLSQHAGDVLNVKDFGAVGDCVTDDSAAFNAASAATRTSANIAAIELAPNGCYKIAGSGWNLTNLDGYLIKGNNSTIISGVSSSHALISAQHSSLWFENLRISVPTPALYGIQIGQDGTTGGDGSFTFTNVLMYGQFVNGGLYDRGAEGSSFLGLTIDVTAGAGYALILDGMCHWALDPTYFADKCTPNSAISFNEQLFLDARFLNFSTTAPSPAIWIGGQLAHSRFLNSYAQSASGSPPVTIYNGLPAGFPRFANLDFDLHLEVNPTSEFFITGPTAAAAFENIKYSNHYEMAAANAPIFKADTTITSVSMANLSLEIGGVMNSGVTVFDQPARYSGTATAFLPTGLAWNAAAGSFQGCTSVGGAMSCLASVPTATFATLPGCTSALAGTTYDVTDATSPTYNGALTGGGAVRVPAVCNGTAWTAH